jgi:TRAP-type C4-dicarboxylate transport system permease small subunit
VRNFAASITNFTGGSMLKECVRALDKITLPIARFTSNLAGNILLLMTAVVLLQIAFRYILNTPLSWTDESSRFLMIYMTYLCLPIIYLDDKNIAMTFVTDKFRDRRPFHLFMMLNHVICLVLFTIWIYFGWVFFQSGSVTASSLPIPMYVVYIIPPLMLSISCLFAIQKLFNELDLFIHFNTRTTTKVTS